MSEAKDELTEKVDNYLNYVVEEWIKKNEVALEHKLKAEIAESFIADLRVFLRNMILLYLMINLIFLMQLPLRRMSWKRS